MQNNLNDIFGKTPKLYNIATDLEIPKDAVNIMRPNEFGNPFILGRDGNRDECLEKYKQWVMAQPNLIKHIKKVLKGKDLVCCCYPKKCHGNILLQIAGE